MVDRKAVCRACRYLGEHVTVEDIPRLPEVGLVDRAEQRVLNAPVQAKVEHPVHVEGVADRAARVEAEPLRPRGKVEQRAGLGPALHDPLARRQQVSYAR